MTPMKLIMGLSVVASLASYAPITEAAPIAASRANVTISNSDSPIVQVVTRVGVAHRSARRTTRRVMRR